MSKIIGVNFLQNINDQRSIVRPYIYSKMPIYQSNGLYTYIWVYKNAHQALRNFFYSLGFNTEYQFPTQISKEQHIVVIREPLERWVSGLVQYLSGRTPNLELTDDIMKICIDHTVMDLHTELQIKFLHGLNFNQCVFFYMDNLLEHNLKHFLESRLGIKIDITIPIRNPSNNLNHKTYITNYLDINQFDRQNLIKSLELDYKLIEEIKNTVGFYEAN